VLGRDGEGVPVIKKGGQRQGEAGHGGDDAEQFREVAGAHGGGMRRRGRGAKSQIPKSQIPKKSQIPEYPNFKKGSGGAGAFLGIVEPLGFASWRDFGIWDFEFWNFFGIWDFWI
jgi:hypothetical protein